MDQQPSLDTAVRPAGSRFLHPLLQALGSLQLAVAVLAVSAAVLVAGTLIEKQHGAEAAHRLVYGTHWFEAIHVLLAVNILAAVLVRFPWRRRQIGFLVTHLGILVLLAGCWATRFAGVEAQLSVFEGHANGTAIDVRTERPFALGFQVHLHKFRRRLDPGSGKPSHYSSTVDFFDNSDPPKKLLENVVITLNAPIDFTDPVSGRTYRLFQSSFVGPWLPGEAEFDQIVGTDHSRDHVYRSVFSVNYDPGRGLKNFGSLILILGIGMVYYFRRLPGISPRTASSAAGDLRNRATRTPTLILFLTLLLPGVGQAAEQRPVRTATGSASSAPGATAGLPSSAVPENRQDAELPPLDWTVWRHLPVLGEGRVQPLDTFAREVVTTVCGRNDPVLVLDHGEAHRFTAAELLFSWLAEPEKWEKRPFLIAADAELRALLGLPLYDAAGHRLRYISPEQAESIPALGRRLADLQERAEAEGRNFRLQGLDRKVKELFDGYAQFRLLTYEPKTASALPDRFYFRFRQSGTAWRKLAGNLQTAKQISKDETVRQSMVDAGDALQKLMGQIHGQEYSLSSIEPHLIKFRQAAERIVHRLKDSADRPSVGLAVTLQRQALEMHLSLYDNGSQLRLVPALNVAALEENRTPGDDASPWLGIQPLLFGSPELVQGYPTAELERVRAAFAEAQQVYCARRDPARPEKFAAAMRRLAGAIRGLAKEVEPLRESLPIQYRDQSLMDATAYPPPGAMRAEVLYTRLNPFFWSWAISLTASVCFLLALGRWRRLLFAAGTMLLVVGLAFTAVGLTFRGFITGFVPLTGMFETVVFVAMYSSLLGLYFAYSPLWSLHPLGTRQQHWQHVLQRRVFVLSGAAVGFIAGVLAYYAPASVMHRNIGPVNPVLRDNFWLAVHVVTIMASYASAAIALILGNIALGYYLFGRYRSTNDSPRCRPPEACEVLARFTYAPLKVTVLLLAAGTILGAFWADKAWGRFWAWDPKEVWALISLLVYMLMLHLRHLGWSRDFGMATTAVFGFTAVLITWYAVNFVLGSGMHSYGSGAGGQYAVGGAVLLQWLFMLAAATRYGIEMRAS